MSEQLAHQESDPSCKKPRTNFSRSLLSKDPVSPFQEPMFRQASKMASGPISPPISPQTDLQDTIDINPNQGPEDPALYPEDTVQGNTDENLFSPVVEVLSEIQNPKNINLRVKSTKRTDDCQEPYSGEFPVNLQSSFRSQVGSLYNRNSASLLNYLRNERIRKPSFTKSLSESSRNSSAVTRTNQRFRSKMRDSVQHSRQGEAANLLARRIDRKQPQFAVSAKPSDLKTARKRAEDTDFESLPNFCPSVSMLTNPKALRADWQGSPLDLSADPNRHLLDEREFSLASSLRLSCATYLCSKRRIFLGRVESLRVGKEFRKTDAQQACKIDVNKASKLWAAFDNGGWFRPSLFQDL